MFFIDQLTSTTIKTGQLASNKEPHIIHYIPDLSANLIQAISSESFTFKLKDVHGVYISPLHSKRLRRVDRKVYYSTLKSVYPKTYSTIPSEPRNNKFLIIDHSLAVSGLSKFESPRLKLSVLFEHLKNSFHDLKLQYPKIEHIPFFDFETPNGLLDILESELIRFTGANSSDLKFFDQKVIGSLQNSNIVFIDYSDSINVHRSALLRLKQGYEEQQPSSKEDDVIIATKPKFIKTANLVDKAKTIDETKMSSERLDAIFKNRRISNDSIAQSLVKYIENENIDVNSLSQEELNKLVFTHLHGILHGPNRPISNELLNNPEKLFDQLELFKEHREPIILNKTDLSAIRPTKDFITIDHVTGPIRHKYEFSEDIHEHVNRLFKTLEDKTAPIDIKNIQYEIKDNNSDRYIEYTVTLQNKSGGIDQPYDIKLRVPYLINNRYFKLNGKEYILSSQQFLTPLTKNTPHEARFLSHYNIITEKLVNFKYSPSNTEEILQYIKRMYGKLVQSYENDGKTVKFKNGLEIDLTNSKVPVKFKNKELRHEVGQYFIYQNDEKISGPIRKREYIYDHLMDVIDNANPNDKLKRSTRSVQYVEIHVMGSKMPLILALWQQLGLTESLVKLGLNFEIVTNDAEVDLKETDLVFDLVDDSRLIIRPKSKREQYVANGLLKLPFISGLTRNDLSKRETAFNYLTETYGTKILNNLDGMVENAIDPITKDLLEYQGLPTNIIDIISGPQLDKLFNDSVDHPSDLSSLRVRLSEYMTQLLYNEINIPVSLSW